MEAMINIHRWGGQGAGKLDKNFPEIDISTSNRTPESIGNKAKNLTLGAVGCRREIGPYSRNMGVSMKNGSAKKEPIQTTYTPFLAAVGANVSETTHM